MKHPHWIAIMINTATPEIKKSNDAIKRNISRIMDIMAIMSVLGVGVGAEQPRVDSTPVVGLEVARRMLYNVS